MNRKPSFLDCPPRYTRTPRLDQSMAEYAEAMHKADKENFFGLGDAVMAVVIVAVLWLITSVVLA